MAKKEIADKNAAPPRNISRKVFVAARPISAALSLGGKKKMISNDITSETTQKLNKACHVKDFFSCEVGSLAWSLEKNPAAIKLAPRIGTMLSPALALNFNSSATTAKTAAKTR